MWETVYGIGFKVNRLGKCIATAKKIFLLENKLPIIIYLRKVKRQIGGSCWPDPESKVDRAWKDWWYGDGGYVRVMKVMCLGVVGHHG